jgi:hypothetical protein
MSDGKYTKMGMSVELHQRLEEVKSLVPDKATLNSEKIFV